MPLKESKLWPQEIKKNPCTYDGPHRIFWLSLIFHSDHGRSNEPMNPLWTRIHRFIWSTTIQVIRIADPNPDHPKGMHPKS